MPERMAKERLARAAVVAVPALQPVRRPAAARPVVAGRRRDCRLCTAALTGHAGGEKNGCERRKAGRAQRVVGSTSAGLTVLVAGSTFGGRDQLVEMTALIFRRALPRGGRTRGIGQAGGTSRCIGSPRLHCREQADRGKGKTLASAYHCTPHASTPVSSKIRSGCMAAHPSCTRTPTTCRQHRDLLR